MFKQQINDLRTLQLESVVRESSDFLCLKKKTERCIQTGLYRHLFYIKES